MTAAFLAFRNKQHAARRVRLGKAAVVIDQSLEEQPHKLQGTEKVATNEQAFDDLTDTQNEDFIFAL